MRKVLSARLVVIVESQSTNIETQHTFDLTPSARGKGAGEVIDAARAMASSLVAPAPAPPKRSAELMPLDDPEGRPIPLSKDNILGRSKTCDIAIPSSKVSRRHSRVLQQNGRFVVEDLGSANHTWVNGASIETPQVLHHGDVISIGDVSFEFVAANPDPR